MPPETVPLFVDPSAEAAVQPEPGYGLRKQVLGPWETLAQSVSAIAPTATPAMTIPLVFALAGNGTWLVYIVATLAVTLVGLVIGCFGRRSASPGSLFMYATHSLPGWAASMAGWALLLAYVATAASVAAGFFNYANVLLHAFLGTGFSPSLLIALAVMASGAMAYRDIKVSAEAMLWMEAASVTCIVIIVALTLWKHGLHLDWAQFRLKGVTGSGVRLGLVLALFSFVGFESATTLGEEAREPLKTIPRAVLQCALGCGAFFTVCAYTEVLGFRGAAEGLDQAAAPLHTMATRAGASLLGTVVDIGAMISMFACTLACITAAARVLMLMSHRGLAHRKLSSTHAKNETPHYAVMATSIACLVPAVAAGGKGRQQHGYLRLDGRAGDLWVYHRVRAGVYCAAAASAADGKADGRGDGSGRSRNHRHGAGAGGERVSGAGRGVCVAAVHLSRLPAGRVRVVRGRETGSGIRD